MKGLSCQSGGKAGRMENQGTDSNGNEESRNTDVCKRKKEKVITETKTSKNDVSPS